MKDDEVVVYLSWPLVGEKLLHTKCTCTTPGFLELSDWSPRSAIGD